MQPRCTEGSMREREIRRALIDQIASRHPGDTLIVEEMGLDQGAIRVDVAVVNGMLAGSEIKSDWDTLGRLPAQRDVYNAVFDQVTLVTGRRHLRDALSIVPEWWGVILAERVIGRPALREERAPARNAGRDPELLARLLWRDEAAAVLVGRGVVGVSGAPRRVLWAKLADQLTVDELSGEVRAAIKARSGWSTARPRS